MGLRPAVRRLERAEHVAGLTIRAIERKAFLQMLAFRTSVIAVVFGLLAWSFKMTAGDRDDNAISRHRDEVYRQEMKHMFQAMSAIEHASTDNEKFGIYIHQVRSSLAAIKEANEWRPQH